MRWTFLAVQSWDGTVMLVEHVAVVLLLALLLVLPGVVWARERGRV